MSTNQPIEINFNYEEHKSLAFHYKIAHCIYDFLENTESIYIVQPSDDYVRLESSNTYISDNIKLQAIVLDLQSSARICYAEYEFIDKPEDIPHHLLIRHNYAQVIAIYNSKNSKQNTTVSNNIDYTIKHDKDKPQLASFPKEAIEAVCEIMEFGANKYGFGTWSRVEAIRYINAAARHLYAMQSVDENGKECIDLSKTDNESGLEHLYHLTCNVVYATALYKRNKEKHKN